jgi:hypothetical protein
MGAAIVQHMGETSFSLLSLKNSINAKICRELGPHRDLETQSDLIETSQFFDIETTVAVLKPSINSDWG